MGLTTEEIKKVDGGYVVEGDMLLTPELGGQAPATNRARGQEEQYRTTNLVSAGCRRTSRCGYQQPFQLGLRDGRRCRHRALQRGKPAHQFHPHHLGRRNRA